MDGRHGLGKTISPAAAATISDERPAATPAISGMVLRTPNLAPEAAANNVLGPGVNVVATARTTMERSASTIALPREIAGTGAVGFDRYTAFMTAHRSAFRSKPMPGASGIATRPSMTGQSSAKPPNGANTCG